ncbi:MAG: hypothetical protein GYA43_01750 [Bacteroidales bacterium]|nr:hypothetical protein [Bacteroidales bacterium]
MNELNASRIIQNAVEYTRPRWSQYDISWKNIDTEFILRGYEQQGFQFFKMKPILENLSILSIDCLGTILYNRTHKQKYDRQFAGSLTSQFYKELQEGLYGIEGKKLFEAINTALSQKNIKFGSTFWKLIYYLLQTCFFLKQKHSSSFAKYLLSKYGSFIGTPDMTENVFLNISETEWETFLQKVKPWQELKGIGPNVFDFIIGDVIEAPFARNSYKFDDSNQHFFKVTGISQLLKPFDRETTSSFLKNLNLNFTLRQINKGIYTYCSETEGENYGFCRRPNKCQNCNVYSICDRIL